MKKAYYCISLLLAAALTACSAGGHTHTSDGSWLSDAENHWQLCSCEEIFNEAAHTLDGTLCTVCGSDIQKNEDGTCVLSTFNENGDCIRMVCYNADGSTEYAYEYEYGSNAMTEKEYLGDLLVAQREHTADTDGNMFLQRETSYLEDGTSTVMEYDASGNELLQQGYSADGTLELDVRYEYTYDADGNMLLKETYENGELRQQMEFIHGSDSEGSWSRSGKTTEYHEDGTKTVFDSDPDSTWSTEITYDADGTVISELRYEYEYDENGESIGSKGYKNGRLFEQMQAVIDANGETQAVIYTEYAEDGSKTVREYDTSFDLVKETVYDAHGNVVS